MITSSALDKIQSVRHGFFTRENGVSQGIYKGLNCGFGSGDDPSNVEQNRAIAMARFGLERHNLNTLYQIHSTVVAYADKSWSLDQRPKADALVTDVPDLAIGIMTADCTPVLFADQKAGVIGASHAGWKGALGGVLAHTVDEMEKRGANRANITAAVGPCIHQESYEVGPEFRDTFLARDARNEAYFKASPKDNHYQFNLPQFVLDQLSRLGLGTVHNSSIDTYANEDKFFSYRRTTHRNEADYGRGLSAIVLKGEG